MERFISKLLIDMGEYPANYTLERVNNSKGYSIKNCVWAIQLKIPSATFWRRANEGMSVAQIIKYYYKR